jgi:hypothetical protein
MEDTIPMDLDALIAYLKKKTALPFTDHTVDPHIQLGKTYFFAFDDEEIETIQGKVAWADAVSEMVDLLRTPPIAACGFNSSIHRSRTTTSIRFDLLEPLHADLRSLSPEHRTGLYEQIKRADDLLRKGGSCSLYPGLSELDFVRRVLNPSAKRLKLTFRRDHLKKEIIYLISNGVAISIIPSVSI